MYILETTFVLGVITLLMFLLYLYNHMDWMKGRVENATSRMIWLPNDKMGPDVFRYMSKNRSARRRNVPLNTVGTEYVSYTLNKLHIHHTELAELEDDLYKHGLKSIRLILGKYNEEQLRDLFRQSFQEHVADCKPGYWNIVSIRDFLQPMMFQIYTRLIFNEGLSELELGAFKRQLNPILNVMKSVGIHYGDLDSEPVRILTKKLENNREKSDLISAILEKAIYEIDSVAAQLNVSFYMGAVIQVLEGTIHSILEVVKDNRVLKKLVDSNYDQDYLVMIVKEVLRLSPLNGATRRGVVQDIEIPSHMKSDRRVIPAGSVIMFQRMRFQRIGWDDADKFIPERWETITDIEKVNYMPFGAKGNRYCPAEKLAMTFITEGLKLFLQKFIVVTNSKNLRLLPSGGIAMIITREEETEKYKYIIPFAKGLVIVADFADRIRVIVRFMIFMPIASAMSVWKKGCVNNFTRLREKGFIKDDPNMYQRTYADLKL